MAYDRVIRNGIVYAGGGLLALDIGISGERITALASPGTISGETEDDAAGRWVLPGFIDAHFHTRAPANPEREDFTSGTASAAAGGVTTLFEMPISTPPAVNATVIASRRAAIERDAHIDVGLYLGSGSPDQEELDEAVAAGVIAFKGFLQRLSGGREDLAGIAVENDLHLLEVLRRVQRYGLPAVFHAEEEPLYRQLTEELKAAGKHDGLAFSASRPDWVEAISIGKLLALAEALDVHVHVPHVTSSMAVDMIRNARRRGAPVTAETCTHYLAFDRSALARFGSMAVCNPPFKSASDVDALWEGVRDGTLDIVTSDHAPFPPEDKLAGGDDIWQAPPGIPGGEILGPYMMSAAVEGRLPLSRVIDALAWRPAEIFGICTTKGAIAPGYDADLVIYDPARSTTVDITTWQSKSRGSATVWDGMALAGTVVSTYSRGTLVFHEGQIRSHPGHGRFVAPYRPA